MKPLHRIYTSSGITALHYLFHAGHHFLNRFACEFHIQSIGAKVDVIIPSYGSVGSYMHLLEVSQTRPKS